MSDTSRPRRGAASIRRDTALRNVQLHRGAPLRTAYLPNLHGVTELMRRSAPVRKKCSLDLVLSWNVEPLEQLFLGTSNSFRKLSTGTPPWGDAVTNESEALSGTSSSSTYADPEG